MHYNRCVVTVFNVLYNNSEFTVNILSRTKHVRDIFAFNLVTHPGKVYPLFMNIIRFNATVSTALITLSIPNYFKTIRKNRHFAGFSLDILIF